MTKRRECVGIILSGKNGIHLTECTCECVRSVRFVQSSHPTLSTQWIIVAIVGKYNEKNPRDWATLDCKEVYLKFRGIARLFDFVVIRVINRR